MAYFRDVVNLGLSRVFDRLNASGKISFLDVFRFLRTIAQSEGGGLQKALKDRGGLAKLRSLHARKDPEVRIEIELSESANDAAPTWRYAANFQSEGKGQQRVLITEESVFREGEEILLRPLPRRPPGSSTSNANHLEQINNNAAFRELGEYFAATTYLHLVPQLLKHSDKWWSVLKATLLVKDCCKELPRLPLKPVRPD